MEELESSAIISSLEIVLSEKSKEASSGKYILVKNNEEIRIPHRNIHIDFIVDENSMVVDCIRILNSISNTKHIESLKLIVHE